MYITKHKFVYTLEEYFNSIINYSVEAGWEIHDNISSTNIVLKSSGERGDTISPMYVNIYSSVSGSYSYIYCMFYGYWDNSSHTGYDVLNTITNGTVFGKLFGSENTLYNRSELYFVGSKDYIMFSFCLYDNSAVYFLTVGGFGIFSNILNSIRKVSVGAVAIGSNVSVVLDSVDDLYINNYYQIFDKTFKRGVERVLIKSIDVGTKTITIDTVTVDFPDGVYLGLNIKPVFVFNSESCYLKHLYATLKVGTSIPNINFDSLALFSNENNYYNAPATTYCLVENPKNIINRNIFYDPYTGLPVGYFDENIRTCVYTDSKNICKSLLCYNNDNSDYTITKSYFTLVSENFSYIEDIRKNWTVDSLVGKYLVIITGMGASQSRKISSNTSNRIYLNNNFILPIDKSSQYIVVDNVFRTLTTQGYSPYSSIWYKDIF